MCARSEHRVTTPNITIFIIILYNTRETGLLTHICSISVRYSLIKILMATGVPETRSVQRNIFR